MAKLAAATLLAIMALLFVYAATFTSAVDITGFTNSTACSGPINDEFPNHPDGACAPFSLANAGSVLFTGLSKCKEGITFDVDCADIKQRSTGPPSAVCFIGGGITSAKWQTVVGCVE